MQMGVCSSIKHNLLAKRYNKIEGIDYFDIFSPIGKSITGQVCKLKKSLYGLKEASRQWNVELIGKLQRYGFIQSPHEHSLFMKSTSNCFLALVVYMDDILLTEDSETELVAIKYQLNQHFTINDLGYAKYFLGLELAESDHSILVTQYKFLHDIFHDAQMLDSKVVSTPLPLGLKLTAYYGALLPNPVHTMPHMSSLSCRNTRVTILKRFFSRLLKFQEADHNFMILRGS
ncbi:Retrovirus-related Pol polyprotein from transposon RE1 [Sesamum angolense]|uniref:Retrovirus-related Pol polyprotein from transposon RE1 n=1 Tax=Sesamum angolense TaxID=2727404 RepID=A0AAE1W3M0_9LAMI|nr:Retrovirus-related Pol polyprotein from transposon RE1 [Sesamum angolense]